MTLEDVKNYLRVTYDDDDGYLTNLMQVAEDYLVAGITDYLEKKKNDHFKTRSEIVKLVIIQNLYDERYLVGQPLEMSYIIRSMITQLEYGDVNV
ncbi:head-tail connector protein [Peptoniphilus sp.]|uniref:head-tail connector protein n=1 Tax=Peptoniphilus sp. TaxID=1971214 RepID=UPI003991FA9D